MRHNLKLPLLILSVLKVYKIVKFINKKNAEGR